MPTYEYACKDCGEHLEVVQSFKDDALTVCPNCEGELRKVFSAAGIIFKGSGWHIKDYKDGSSKPASAPKADSSSKDSSSDSSTSSSKDSGSKDTGSSASGEAKSA
jgi:putative FmdB family regulatory protein